MVRRLRWVTMLLAVALVPPLIVGGFVLQRSARANERDGLEHELATTRDTQVQSLANYFTEARKLTVSYANDAGFSSAFPSGNATSVSAARARRGGPERAFTVLQRLYPGAIQETCLIDRRGPELARLVDGKAAKLPDLSPDESGAPFFRGTLVLAPGQVYQARPYRSPDTHQWVISNSSQLLGFSRAPAIAHFEISVESFRRHAAAQAGRMDVQVLDAHTGAVVFDARTPQRMTARLGRPGDHRFASVVRTGREHGVTQLAGRVVSFARLPRHAGNLNDWYVVAVAPVGALGGGLDAGALGLWLGAALLLISLGILSVFTRAIVKRLRRIDGLAAAIARGELTAATDATGEASREARGHRRGDALDRMEASFDDMSDYLGEMAHAAERIADGDLTIALTPRAENDALGQAFSRMVERLRTLVGRLAGSSTQLAAASQELAATSDEARRAIEEIAGAAGDVARGAERQVQMVQTTSAAADEASAAATAGADGAQRGQAAMDLARSVVGEGVNAATAAGEAMTRISTANGQIAGDIEELSLRTERIGGIVDTITAIAEQTNLLALNAAIEAARAGEHGRGFAVVAEEVGRLAAGSRAAAGEIAELIGEIQSQTRGVVATVQHGTHETANGVEIATRTQRAFADIGTSVDGLGAQVGEIAEALEQIADVGRRMQSEITNVAHVAEQSSASAEQVSASTQQTSASTQEIASSAAAMARTAEELEREVAAFRTV
jgi:methyl-accepting chemotaxis protein